MQHLPRPAVNGEPRARPGVCSPPTKDDGLIHIGPDAILLPLSGDRISVDQQIETVLQEHNKEAEIVYAAARAQHPLNSRNETRIAQYIATHNRKAALRVKAEQAQDPSGTSERVSILSRQVRRNNDLVSPIILEAQDPETGDWRPVPQLQEVASSNVKQCRLKRSPDKPNQLQSYNPREEKWIDIVPLGKFLEDRYLWALLDDFELENSKEKANIGDGTGPASLEQFLERAEGKDRIGGDLHPIADNHDPATLAIVISCNPQQIAEASEGQHWLSCTGKDYFGIDQQTSSVGEIKAGTIIAWLVAYDFSKVGTEEYPQGDPNARYPLMRAFLKQYKNPETGEIIWSPAAVYGAERVGNLGTRDAFVNGLRGFLREHVNVRQTEQGPVPMTGEFVFNLKSHNDGEPRSIVLSGRQLDEATLRSHMEWYINYSLRTGLHQKSECESYIAEHGTFSRDLTEEEARELQKNRNILAGLYRKFDNLGNPVELAKGYARYLRATSFDALPENADILAICKEPEFSRRNQIYAYVLSDKDTDTALLTSLADLSFEERVAWGRPLLAIDRFTHHHKALHRVADVWEEGVRGNTRLELSHIVSEYTERRLLAYVVANVLPENTATYLDLSNNNLYGVAGTLAEGLEVNTSLTYLDLSRNSFYPEDIQVIVSALRGNHNLTYLNFSQNAWLDTQKIVELGSLIISSRNPNITCVIPAEDALRAYCDSNKSAALELARKLLGDPSRLTGVDFKRIEERTPAIRAVAESELHLSEAEIAAMFGVVQAAQNVARVSGAVPPPPDLFSCKENPKLEQLFSGRSRRVPTCVEPPWTFPPPSSRVLKAAPLNAPRSGPSGRR